MARTREFQAWCTRTHCGGSSRSDLGCWALWKIAVLLARRSASLAWRHIGAPVRASHSHASAARPFPARSRHEKSEANKKPDIEIFFIKKNKLFVCEGRSTSRRRRETSCKSCRLVCSRGSVGGTAVYNPSRPWASPPVHRRFLPGRTVGFAANTSPLLPPSTSPPFHPSRSIALLSSSFLGLRSFLLSSRAILIDSFPGDHTLARSRLDAQLRFGPQKFFVQKENPREIITYPFSRICAHFSSF
jgi:hypothetical protein